MGRLKFGLTLVAVLFGSWTAPAFAEVFADSEADWSADGTQGENGWSYGWYNYTNDDDQINIQDLSLIGGKFRLACGDPGWDERADINDDCAVNISDLVLAGGNWHRTSPVPWP